jgi:benzodiazapine receptor
MGAAWSVAAAIALPLGSGMIVGITTKDEVKPGSWYQKIRKPKWNPPNWVFGPAWTTLYTAMGVASWLVYSKGKEPQRTPALVLYGVQLFLNLIWNPLMFKGHKLDVALADSVAMLGVATAATVAMTKSHKPEAILPLMVPYLAWVTFATTLTGEILRLNPKETLVDYSKLKRKGKRAAKNAKAEAKSAKADAKAGAQTAQDKAQAAGDKAQSAADKAAAAAEQRAKEL